MVPVPDPDIDSPIGNSAIRLIYGSTWPHAGNIDAVSVFPGGAGWRLWRRGAWCRPLRWEPAGDALASWAERSGRRRAAEPVRGGLRFAFYGRVSTEDYQDPVTSRARQLGQAAALVAGHGQIVAEYLRCRAEPGAAVGAPPAGRRAGGGDGRPGPRLRRDRDRGVRAGVLRQPVRADGPAVRALRRAAVAARGRRPGRLPGEGQEEAMLALGVQSKREITRTRIRVRTAMAAQAREQGRYLGGRPPYGYRLADAGPHPNKAHAAWGRRAWRLEPDPQTAPVVEWIFSAAAGRAFPGPDHPGTDRGEHPVPVCGRPGPQRAPRRGAVVADHGAGDPGQPPLHRPAGVEPAADRHGADRSGQHRAGAPVQRWGLPDGWVISARPAHPALVSEEDFIAAQGIRAERDGTDPGRRYRLAGLLRCGICGRRAESCWSNNHPAYRCRHGHSSASAPDPARPKNLYIREDRILPHLPALYMLLAGAEPAAGRRRRRTRRGADVQPPGQRRGRDRLPAHPADHPHLRPADRDPAGRHARSRDHRHRPRKLTPGRCARREPN